MEAPQGQQEISSQQFIIPAIEPGTEAGTPEPEKPFAEFQSAVRAVAISPHGRRRIAVGLEDGTIEIWDVLTGQKWLSCKGHTEPVRSLGFSPDGSMVASGSHDQTVRLWDVYTGEAIGQTFSGHTSYVNSVAFSPDGSKVVSGSWDNTVRLWDVHTGEIIGQPFSGHTYSVNSVAFSPDGSMVVSGSRDNTLRLWDINTGEAIGQPFSGHTEPVRSVAFSPDGNTVVSGSEDHTVRLWDVNTGEAIGQSFSGHTDPINSVAFSSDGKTVVSGSEDNTVRLWNVNTGEAIAQPFSGHINSVTSVAFSADGSIVVSGSRDKTVWLWDVITGKAIAQPFSGHTSSVRSIAFSPDGSMVVSGSEDNTVRLWDVNTGEAIGQLFSGHTSSVMSVAFSPDGSMVVSGSRDNTLRLWDVNTGEAIGQLFSGHTSSVRSVAFSPDGSMVVSSSRDNTMRLWDARTGETIGQPFSGHTSSVRSVAFSPDGSMVVSGSCDNTMRLWDARTGEAIGQPFSGHTEPITSVTFSPDGSTVVSGSSDKTVRLWDVSTGQAIGQPFSGHTNGVRSVAFSPDGSTVVSGSYDKTVRLWDISDPQRKRQIEIGKQEKVYSVAFDPLGDYIISAGEDGIKVWRWQRFNIRRVPQAFRNDQPSGEDSLDVAKELQSLADVLMLRSLEPPLAVAILGSWGSGKSFGMHLIEKQITKIRCQQITAKQTWGDVGDEPNLSPYVGHVYQIKFNAWSYAKSDLWASLMQTIFDQLDRQLTLEKQLREVGKVSDLAGGEIWSVLNQMNDSERKTILEDKLSEEVFAELKEKNADGNALWDILSEVRQEEQEKLKRTEEELQRLEAELKTKNQELEREFKQKIAEVEREVDKDKEIIERKVNQEFENTSIVIVFLTQLKELSKDDFGDFICKDFLNSYGFENREDLETQIPIVKDLDQLEKSNLIDQVENLIKNKDSTIEDIIKKSGRIKNYVEEQPSKIVGFIEFIKKDKKIVFIFVAATSLPFIFYSIIVYILPTVLPFIKQISSALKFWLTTISTIPAIGIGVEIYKKLRVFQAKTSRLFQVAKESVKQEKQKLAAEKDKKIQAKIEEKDFEQQKNQVYQEKEAAKQALTTEQQEIEKLQAQVERQKQLVGLTAQYTSLVDFVNNRLEEDSYQKMLGLMHQIQDDLADLSEHLTYQPGKTHPEKLKVLKEYFPRGPARIVLYIDDLDRCPPKKVVEVLEAVQLLLNTNIFIIVLAIDDRYIGRALEHNYRGVLKRGGTPSGVDYLEKIIQIPYRMRPISKNVTVSYLKSLVDIEEESKKDSQNISNSQQLTDENPFFQQTTGEDSIPLQQLNYESSFLTELPENLEQDEFEQIPVDSDEQTEDDFHLPVYTPTKNPGVKGISEPKTQEDNSKEKNRKIQHSANTDPLVTRERFTAEEFAWISESCQHVDLTPRTAKRLINICKIIKIIWTPVLHDTTWKQEPKQEYKQTLIAFLALAGRYPKEIRKILEEIYLEFEEEDANTVIIEKDDLLNRLQKQDGYMDSHNQREWKKFKNDFQKMSPQDKFYFETRTLNLAISFCFVGDIGYDPDDHYNREYRFEDKKKDYDFYRDNV
ncbi:P-loop NTPase fold protein [Anabaena catenula]|uniref:PQQ-binding-like beta-propeller repeat protein n=1 Tax=Anabaena catenula FACHB-362 TaxID=2692877 RepID=A0ABR8IYE0_9NOST|nr:P-loop NTPase fold protein [Anabaena catenula]MBD2690320.1 PQQ-binding-like beta-propeller repeat protein [Anabaena catenula FACHB-362]